MLRRGAKVNSEVVDMVSMVWGAEKRVIKLLRVIKTAEILMSRGNLGNYCICIRYRWLGDGEIDTGVC